MSKSESEVPATELVRAQRLRWPQWLPYIIAAGAVLILIGVLAERLREVSRFIWPIFVPLLISLALAYILEPIVLWCERRGLTRRNAILATLGALLLLLVLAAVFVVPPALKQLSIAAGRLPDVLGRLAVSVEPHLQKLQTVNGRLYERLHNGIAEAAANPAAALEPAAAYLTAGMGGLFGFTTSLFDAILVPFFVFYILLDLPRLRTNVELVIPPRHRTTAHEVFDRVAAVGSNFIRGQITIGSILSILYVAGFVLIGVPLALVLGVISGFALLIPYIGPIGALLLTCTLTILDSPEWWRVGAVVGCFALVQTSEVIYLSPQILGEKLELHPFLVLAGVTVGGHLFGILGMILATPTIAVTRVFVSYAYHSYLHSRFYTGPAPDLPVLPESPPTAAPPQDAYAEVSQMAGDDDVSAVTGEPIRG